MSKVLNLCNLLISITFMALCACGSPDTAGPTQDMQVEAPPTLQTFIDHPRRDGERARDQFRNPKETLEFFGLKPGSSVVEIWPGWYTNIIAPYLAANGGTYIAAYYPEGHSERLDQRILAFRETYGDTDVYGDIQIASFWGDSGLSLEPDSVDMILTFRNVHNWMQDGYADKAFAEFYDVLKPGGILGVVEHRLPETALQDPRGATGYVQESYMKMLATEAGFEFVGASEVNANPRDTADHPLGVWTLPPRSRLPEDGSEEAGGFDAGFYKTVGESDRATLKFRKPGKFGKSGDE